MIFEVSVLLVVMSMFVVLVSSICGSIMTQSRVEGTVQCTVTAVLIVNVVSTVLIVHMSLTRVVVVVAVILL